ncbi:MAG: response regulator transcription factor [Bacteroidota bacterium]
MTTVMIIDDAPLLRERLAKRIEAIEGIEVVGEADTVASSIDLFRKLRPTAVILDMQMPGGTGLEVLNIIKSERPKTIVLVLTNYPLPQLKKKSMDLGADYFFDKSTEFDRIVEVLKDGSSPGGGIAIPREEP